MANRRSLASLEKRIELTETKLRAAKARYDKLADELLNLKREKTARESEKILKAIAKSFHITDFLGIFCQTTCRCLLS